MATGSSPAKRQRRALLVLATKRLTGRDAWETRRIDVSSDGKVSIDGKASDEHLDLASADEVTFPGVWLGGTRQYEAQSGSDCVHHFPSL